MRRNRFEQILRLLHFCDNSTFDPASKDKCWKITPIVTEIKSRFKLYALLTPICSVDESMIKYCGKYGQLIKQHMPQKPIRFGYKVWCLNLSGGYLYTFDVYQGAGSRNKFSDEFTVGASVVISLVDTLPDGNYRVYCENYFTTAEMLDYLAKRGVGVTGTVKANMTKKCPLIDKKAMRKEKKRGYMESYIDSSNHIIMVRWNDNSQVTEASSFEGLTPKWSVKRWSQKKNIYK